MATANETVPAATATVVPDLLAGLPSSLIDSIQAGFVVLDREYRVVLANKFLRDWTKRSPEELCGQQCFKLFHAKEQPCADCPCALTFRTGETAQTTHTGVDKEGGLTYAELTSYPVRNERGEIEYAIEYARDVSERVRFERENASLVQALRESEEKYRTMVEHCNDAIWVLDRSGALVWFNRRGEELIGFRLEEWLGKPFARVIVPEDLAKAQWALGEALAGRPQTFEARVRRAEGGTFVASFNTTPLLSKGEVTGTISFSKDVTHTREAEEQLVRRSNELEVLNAVSLAVGRSLDIEAIVSGALDSVLTMMGLRPRGGIFLLNEDRTELRLAAHRGLPPEMVLREQRVAIGECLCGLAAQTGELLCSTDSSADCRHTRPDAGEPHAHIVVPLKSRNRVQGVLFLYPPPGYVLSPSDQRLFTTLGGQIGVAIENARLYRRTDEALQKRVVELTAALDEIEVERTKAKEIERLKDDFVAMISHDLRSPLTAILAQADLLRRRAAQQGDTSCQKGVELILRSSQRMRAMISDLVDSARLESGQIVLRREPLAAGALIDDIVRALPAADRQRVKVVCPQDFPPVVADRDRIERAITNLLTNALKFSSAESQVTVQVRSEGTEAVVSVTDQGIGIDAEHLPHLFERFYRARPDKGPGGLGLGLYITRLLVGLHGGRLWAETVKGRGSTFTFTLPLATPLD